MVNLYENLGKSTDSPLETAGMPFDTASVSMEPGHGTVKRGTVLYRKAGVLFAPAAAENILITNELAVLREDVNTDESATVAALADVITAGSLLAGRVVLADGETTLNSAQALILREQGIALKPFDDLNAAAVVADNAFPGVKADADIEDDDGTLLLGKVASDLQTGITINGDVISGTLKYISDYSSAGYTGDEQSGNFLALHFESEVDGATIKVELVGGTHGEKTLDDDGLCIFRVTSTTQTIKVTVVAEGYNNTVKTYALTGLTLNNA